MGRARGDLPGLGSRIRDRRFAQGMKLAALAGKAGISTSYLCELETGDCCSPSAVVLHRIAVALHTTVGQLLDLPSEAGNPVDPTALPPSLNRARAAYRFSDDEVALLGSIEYRGKRPRTEEDWYFLICAIRRAVG